MLLPTPTLLKGRTTAVAAAAADTAATAATAAAPEDRYPGGTKTPAAGGVADPCAISGDDKRLKLAFLRIRRRRTRMVKMMMAAIPKMPRAMPIPAAAPFDKPVDAIASWSSLELALADIAVEEGVKATVAVKTTVTDDRTLPELVLVGDDVPVDEMVDTDPEAFRDDEGESSPDVLNRSPVKFMGSPSWTRGVASQARLPT